VLQLAGRTMKPAPIMAVNYTRGRMAQRYHDKPVE
jgi:hypothetical protein